MAWTPSPPDSWYRRGRAHKKKSCAQPAKSQVCSGLRPRDLCVCACAVRVRGFACDCVCTPTVPVVCRFSTLFCSPPRDFPAGVVQPHWGPAVVQSVPPPASPSASTSKGESQTWCQIQETPTTLQELLASLQELTTSHQECTATLQKGTATLYTLYTHSKSPAHLCHTPETSKERNFEGS